MEDIKEKTADKMFEELGYEKQENETIIFYFQYNGSGEKFGFEFYKDEDKEIYPVCYADENEAIIISMQELQAINKKCKELGWI